MKSILITLGALAAAVVAAAPLTGQFAADVPSNELRLVSAHHATPIQLGGLPAATSVALRVQLGKAEGGHGLLSLDPNDCTLDPWGDPDLCTDMAPAIYPVTLHRLRLEDPWGIGRTLYELEGLPSGEALRFVAPPPGGPGGFRLVHLDRLGEPDRVLLLARVP